LLDRLDRVLVSLNTNASPRVLHANNLAAIQRALEAAGVEFIAENGGGAGARLPRKRPAVFFVAGVDGAGKCSLGGGILKAYGRRWSVAPFGVHRRAVCLAPTTGISRRRTTLL
jgi:hypothetical protein